MSESDIVIRARGVSQRFAGRPALTEIDLAVPAHRVVGLIGPNGAGKTTLINRLLGLLVGPGTIRVLGLDPARERHALMQQICFIADVATLPRWLRVAEAIRLMVRLHPGFSAAVCETLLANTDIPRRAHIGQLSKGMVAQLHLVLVLAVDARLLVLDEPTLGLDLLNRRRFYDRLLEHGRSGQRTLLITTHDVAEIEPILTDVIFLDRGRKVLDSSMDALAERFVEVVVPPAVLTEARTLEPCAERCVRDGYALIFDRSRGRDLSAIERLATARNHPTLADLFVAFRTQSNA